MLKWRKAAACAAGRRPDRLLVRARPRRQVLGAQPADRARAAHPQGRRGLDRLRGGDPARLLQHRLLRRAVLDQPRRPTCAPSTPRSATTARPRSTSASAAATARAFRAIEDRLADLKAFFLSARPTDLWQARGLASPRDLEVALDAEFGEGAVAAAGSDVFAENCARCHSSQEVPRDHRLHRDRPGRPDAAARLARQRRGGARLRDRHLPGARAALEPHAEPGLGASTPRSTRTSARPTRCARR